MIRHHTVRVTGWVAVAASAFFVSVWGVWGAIENFHEGWWYRSFWLNAGMMVAQYLAPALLFAIAGIASVARPRAGVALHVLLILGVFSFFRGTQAGRLLIALPLLGVAVLYWLGRARPKKAAYSLLVGLFLGIVIGVGARPAWRVAHRYNDGILDARVVEGNGVRLRWAPAGPGWPDKGATWQQAMARCGSLSADGRAIEAAPRHIWRLPSIDEAVRSLVRAGNNAGGVWEAASGRARYARKPDKESPLWDIYSPVIYWWTATELDDRRAWRVGYNGATAPTPKTANWSNLAYRCVTAAEPK